MKYILTVTSVDHANVTDLEFPHDDVGLAYRQNSTLLPGARAVMELIRTQCALLPGHAPADVSR